jgi:saccharopine dehydrogenase-like NADP-dependent oxidoreductase
MSSSELRNIIVYGAGGNNIGFHILKNLLSKSEQFNVSVLARASSKTTYPPTAKVIRLPDSPSHADYVAALEGQDAVVSAVSYPAKLEEPKIIDAAVSAGVKWFVPSEYGIDNSLPATRQLNVVFGAKGNVQDYLKTKESQGLSWTGIATGLWLDW